MTHSSETPSLEEFLLALTEERPDGLSSPLRALWFDANNDWRSAHHCVDTRSDVASMRAHAYLHRKAGDLTNAAYWYRRAGLRPYKGALSDEWLEIAKMLCS